MGRRKIEMQMVQDSSSRQVTFSKRRTGLFKKANELATLCGAEVAVVVFSPGGKPFSFGQPNVESIADRFLNEEDEEEDPNPGDCFVGSCSSKDEGGERLNQELGDVLKQLEAEKKRGESLDRALKRGKGPMGLKNKAAIGEINLPELQKLKGSLEELHENVKARASDMEASSSLLLLSNQPVRKAKAVAKSG